MKYISIDMEMTGLDAQKCDILEFAAVIDELEKPLPLNELPKFHCIFRQDSYVCQPGAAAMHQRLFKIIDENDRQKYNFISPMKLGKQFKDFLKKNGYLENHQMISINVAGKNFASFDEKFLNNKTDFSKHIRIRARLLDPSILYMSIHDEKVPDLQECKFRAGFREHTVSHEAFDDALDVVRLIRKKFLIDSAIYESQNQQISNCDLCAKEFYPPASTNIKILRHTCIDCVTKQILE